MRERMNVQRLEHTKRTGIARSRRLDRTLLQRLCDSLGQRAFLPRTDDDIRLQCGQRIGRGRLRITADQRDDRLRILLARLMDLLAALGRCRIGHAAGVDDVHIGRFPKADLCITGLLHRFQIMLRLIRIHLASQRSNCKRRHFTTP